MFTKISLQSMLYLVKKLGRLGYCGFRIANCEMRIWESGNWGISYIVQIVELVESVEVVNSAYSS